MVCLLAGVEDAVVPLALDARSRAVLVHPLGEEPLLLRHVVEDGLGARARVEGLYEGVAPGLVVEEDDGVAEPLVEVALEALDGPLGLLDLLVARQHDNGGILTGGGHVGLSTRAVKGDVELATGDGHPELQGVEADLDEGGDEDDP